MDEVTMRSLRPIRLTVQNVGPFQGATPTVLHFLVPATASAVASVAAPEASTTVGRSAQAPIEFVPCDIFVIQGGSGTGKSFLLESIHGLFDLLACRPTGLFALYGQPILHMFSDLAYKRPFVQLDAFATCSIDGHARPVVFTLWFGADTPSDPRSSSAAMREATAGREWICIGFVKGLFGLAPGTNEAGRRLLEAISCSERTKMLVPRDRLPSSGVLRPLPTALCFSRTRNGWASKAGIDTEPSLPSYAPAKLFHLDEAGADRIARQLSALARADRERFDRLLADLNEFAVFDERPRTVVTRLINDHILVDKDRRWSHPLSKLGTSQSAMITAYAFVVLNATEAMLTMIDGSDAWTDMKSRGSLTQSLFSLYDAFPRQMLILTTTDLDFFRSIIDGANRLGLSSDGVMLSDV